MLQDLSYKIIGGALLISVPVLIIFLSIVIQPDQKLIKDYQRGRIMSFLYPENEEYSDDIEQQNNSKTAIASGELVGKKLSGDDSATSVNEGNFVSENQTDFIFAVAGEEYGFLSDVWSSYVLLLAISFECIRMSLRGKGSVRKDPLLRRGRSGRSSELYQHLCCHRTGTKYRYTASVCQLWTDFAGQSVYWYGTCAECRSSEQRIQQGTHEKGNGQERGLLMRPRKVISAERHRRRSRQFTVQEYVRESEAPVRESARPVQTMKLSKSQRPSRQLEKAELSAEEMAVKKELKQIKRRKRWRVTGKVVLTLLLILAAGGITPLAMTMKGNYFGTPVQAFDSFRSLYQYSGIQRKYAEQSLLHRNFVFLQKEMWTALENATLEDGQKGLLFNLSNHKVLYAKGIYDRVYPASITKIMTAMLVL